MPIHGMLVGWDVAVIVVYITALLTLGFWVSFKKGHSEDLFLAGRRLGWANIGFSIFGTNISPGMMIGSCGVAYASGMVAANFEWLAWPFLMLLGMVFLPHYLNTRISTMPEFMLKRFGSNCREFMAYFTVFATLWVWIGGTLFAGGILLGQILDWPLWVSVIVLAVIATSFTITGGLMAVAITDTFQSILMIVASTVLTTICFLKVGSLDNLMHGVPESFWHLFKPATDSDYPWYAVLLGYPTLAIWFWCADQAIVQRALGGRDLHQGQVGTWFVSILKIITPFIFFLPGILCKILQPNLAKPDEAYMTLVKTYMPVGMVGAIVSILIAASVSMISGGLNSLSTVLTLDIYCKKFRPNPTQKETLWLGRITTLLACVLGILIAIAFGTIKNLNLFALGQAMLSFLSPSLGVVFIVGVLWKRATGTAAFLTLVIGNIVSMSLGTCYLFIWPGAKFWPHYLMMAFYLFVGMTILMIIISLCTTPDPSHQLPSIREAYRKEKASRSVWLLWAVVGVLMVVLYIIFN
jgi:solute:Na+ symporter, SSS family